MRRPILRLSERRSHDRVPLHAEVVLEGNGRRERTTAHDVSLGGAFVALDLSRHIEYKTGARCTVTLHVDEDTPTHCCEEGHTIRAAARIVRRDPGGPGRPQGLGMEFERVDLENLERLRALVNRGS